jgi:hypothetical protein
MRRLLGSLVPALLLGCVLSACGDDGPAAVTDEPAPSASGTPTTSPTKGGTGEPVDFDVVEVITETAAGGTVSPTAVPLGDDTAVEEFLDQFETDGMRTRVLDAVRAAKVPDDKLLYGAVVAIGCDSPDQVVVTSASSGLVITVEPVESPLPECFAPMTTVALVLVPAAAG